MFHSDIELFVFPLVKHTYLLEVLYMISNSTSRAYFITEICL